MKRIEIPLNKLEVEPFKALKQYLLITSGENELGKYNSMTVDWGFFGTIWRRPCVLLSIRPTRYTYEFISKYPDFTVSSFSPSYRDILVMLGKKSGKDSNKMNESGLVVINSQRVLSPSFQEAAFTFECKKLFATDLNKDDIIEPTILNEWYPEGNFHKIIIGEIVSAYKNL